MKIVTVMNNTARGGADFGALEMLDALIDRGHEAVLLSDRPGVAEGFKVRVDSIDIGPKLSTTTWPSLVLRWRSNLRRLAEALRREAPYDVLLVHYKKDQLMACRLPKPLRAAVVWAEWGPVPFPMRRGIPRRMYVDAARQAAAIMAVSAGTKRSVCDLGVPEDAVEIVPNVMRTDEIHFSAEGRDRVRRELDIPAEAFVVGCISRFHHKKRNDVVIDAVGRLPGEPHLVLAGEGDTEPQLRAQAEPLLGRRSHFVETPGDDVADYLSAFDVLVFCPSPTEGEPRAVILGMLAERPTVSTGAEGVADMIGAGVGEITSPEHDPAALAETLRAYMEDPGRREREGAEARRRAVATYSAPIVARQVEDLFRAAVDGRGTAEAAAASPAPGMLVRAARTVPYLDRALIGAWKYAPIPAPRRSVLGTYPDGRRMWCDLSDHTQRKMPLDNFEPRESKLLRDHLAPGDTFVDVGAHIDWFTVLAAGLVTADGSVFAFEPFPGTLSCSGQTSRSTPCRMSPSARRR